MKITDLSVDGFGVWTGLELGELSDGLNVFYGPNEAGKTTLMQFVRAVFFGFSPERRGRYLPPVHGGRPGGRIRANLGGAAWSIARHTDDGHLSHLIVSAPGEAPREDEPALAALLHDVDEPTFTNVFVLGLREMQELATLGDTQAAEELYSLAAGLDRVSLAEVLKELDASRKRLLSDDERPSLIAQLIGQRDRIKSELDDLGQSADRYLALATERRQLDAEIATLEQDAARADELARHLALARGLADKWYRRQTVNDRLRLAVGLDALPEAALARFDEAESQLQKATRRMRKLKRSGAEVRKQLAAAPINEALSRQSMRLEALAEQQPWITALEKQVRELENQVLELQLECEEGQKQWGGANLGGLSKRAIDELRDAARKLASARRQAQAIHGDHSAADSRAASLKQQIDSALGQHKDKGLTQAVAEAGQLVADLRRRVQLDERIAQMSSRAGELEEKSHERLEEQMLPTWALAGLGSLFVLGCALMLLFVAGLLLPGSLGESIGWPVGALGLGAAGIAGIAKIWMEGHAERRLDKTQSQQGMLVKQLADAKAERDELDEILPRGGGPLITRLQNAEKALARLEGLLPLQVQTEAAEREREAGSQSAAALREACQQARKRWRQMLANHGLPADLPPNQLKAYARGRGKVAEVAAELTAKKTELARRKAEHETLTTRVKQLVAQTGVTPRSAEPVAQLQQCLAELAEQQRQLAGHKQLNAELTKLRKRYQKLARTRNRWRRRRLWLLRAAGTLDEQEFRRRAAMQAEAQRLNAEHAQLEQEIGAVLAGVASGEQIMHWLTAGQDLEQLDLQSADQRRAISAHLNAARERRGEMNVQLKLMVEDRQLPSKRLELDQVEKRLAEAVDRWRVLAVCGLLLEAVREYYQREHQPQALREASKYLSRLTAGRYRRVWTPLGDHVLYVEDAEGSNLGVEVLSSGTREQLFLALRLALASAFARRGIRLPLVLDDVLVNFDVTRAKAAATVLRDFAKEGHQILLFTCHEHIARLFRGVKADVRQLPTRGAAELVFDEEPAPPKSKKVEPEPVPLEVPVVVAVEPEPAPAPPPPPPVVTVVEPVHVILPRPVHLPIALHQPPRVEPVRVELPKFEPVRVELPAPAPVPAPRPAVRRPRRRLVHSSERIRWSAEEFDGELADRVRRDIWIEVEPEEEPADDSAAA